MQLRTLVSAHLSFKEDCGMPFILLIAFYLDEILYLVLVSNRYIIFFPKTARILRGLRIAARLGLSLSKDIETAIPEFVSSVANVGQVF